MVPKGGAHGLRQRHVTNLAALRQREHVLTADALELVADGRPTALVVEFVFREAEDLPLPQVRVRQGLADLFKSADGDGGPSGAARAGRRQGFRRYPSQRAVRDPTAFPASQVRHGMAHPFRVAEEM